MQQLLPSCRYNRSAANCSLKTMFGESVNVERTDSSFRACEALARSRMVFPLWARATCGRARNGSRPMHSRKHRRRRSENGEISFLALHLVQLERGDLHTGDHDTHPNPLVSSPPSSAFAPTLERGGNFATPLISVSRTTTTTIFTTTSSLLSLFSPSRTMMLLCLSSPPTSLRAPSSP